MLHACTHAQAHCTHTARTLHAQDTLDSPDHTEHPLALHVEARIIAYEAAFDRIVSLSGHYSRSMIDGFHAFCKSQSGEQVNDKKLASCINQHAVMFRRFEFDKIQGHTESRTGSRTGLWPLADKIDASEDPFGSALQSAYELAGLQYPRPSQAQSDSGMRAQPTDTLAIENAHHYLLFPFKNQLLGCMSHSDWSEERAAGSRCVSRDQGRHDTSVQCPVLQIPLDLPVCEDDISIEVNFQVPTLHSCWIESATWSVQDLDPETTEDGYFGRLPYPPKLMFTLSNW